MKPSKRDLIVVKLCLVVLLLALAGASGFRTGASPAPGRHSNNFDTEPPTVSITGLADGATVSGAFWLRATARDETGVAGVRFTLDGADLGPEDTTEPFAMLVDGRALSVGPHLLTATARDVTGNATTTAVTEIRIRQPVDSHLLNTLEPGEWLEIPDSDMRQVAPVDPPGDVECVITCWSGAAYDSLENRMIVWGGGHGQYGGNELYAFDLDLLQWTRLTEPSIIDQDDTAETYADGRPRSVHTYDMLQFDESTNSFCSFGLSALYPGIQERDNLWCFDFAVGEWDRRFVDFATGGGIGSSWSDIDPTTGRIWLHTIYSDGDLLEYDPVTNSFFERRQTCGVDGICLDLGIVGVIDPVRRNFFGFGRGTSVVWDISGSLDYAARELTTQGPQDIANGNHPGLQYDALGDQIVAWVGGSTVYYLDLGSMTWTTHDSGASVPPLTQNGANGRWRYAPAYDAFILVQGIDTNVWAYKPLRGSSGLIFSDGFETGDTSMWLP